MSSTLRLHESNDSRDANDILSSKMGVMVLPNSSRTCTSNGSRTPGDDMDMWNALWDGDDDEVRPCERPPNDRRPLALIAIGTGAVDPACTGLSPACKPVLRDCTSAGLPSSASAGWICGSKDSTGGTYPVAVAVVDTPAPAPAPAPSPVPVPAPAPAPASRLATPEETTPPPSSSSASRGSEPADAARGDTYLWRSPRCRCSSLISSINAANRLRLPKVKPSSRMSSGVRDNNTGNVTCGHPSWVSHPLRCRSRYCC